MAETPHQELVIIKRHGGHEEGHHGGAWKIAFADFMTAMMALFLVLWLISATNPKQRVVIARYFNPVKLADISVEKKGLDDPVAGGGPSHSSGKKDDSTPAEKQLELPPLQEKRSLFDQGLPTRDEISLFRDPYGVLAEIAAQGGTGAQNTKSLGQPGSADKSVSQSKGPADRKPEKPEKAEKLEKLEARSNDSFRDPFATVPQPDPQHGASRSQAAASVEAPAVPPPATSRVSDLDALTDAEQVANSVPVEILPNGLTTKTGKETSAPKPVESAAAKPLETVQAVSQPALPPAPDKTLPAVKETQKPASQTKAAEQKAAEQNAIEQKAIEQKAIEQKTAADIKSNEAEATKIQADIANAMTKEAASQVAPNVEVKATSEGVLISLTDESNYTMFAVGSAEPQAKTIEVMSQVAQLLKSRQGMIVVRGHTDGRPYKSGTYDNWQLSAARAQMAHYMLVRGGLDEKRIERIEGYADHRLKNSNDPLAAENRRIEILLRKDKS